MGCVDCHGGLDVHGGPTDDPASSPVLSRMGQAVGVTCEHVDNYVSSTPAILPAHTEAPSCVALADHLRSVSAPLPTSRNTRSTLSYNYPPP